MGTYGTVNVGGLLESADTPQSKVLLERAKHRESRGEEWGSLLIEARLENEKHRVEMGRLSRPMTEFDLEMQELAKRYGG